VVIEINTHGKHEPTHRRARRFRRREIIGGLSIVTFPRRLVMAAQSPNPIVGLLNGGSPDLFQDRLTSINLGMAEAISPWSVCGLTGGTTGCQVWLPNWWRGAWR
jgi:hypothetical protein